MSLFIKLVLHKMATVHIILIIIAHIGFYSSRLILSPQTTEVLEDEDVLLTCSLTYRSRAGRWLWRGSNLFIRVYPEDDRCLGNIYQENRTDYLVFCNTSSSSILIRNVSRSRHGERWICEEEMFWSKPATIFVIVPVISVQMEPMKNTLSTEDNTTAQLSCSTSFARPPPNITWYLTGKDTPFLEENDLQITNNTEGLFSSRSTLLLNVNRSFHGQSIYCSASNYQSIVVDSSRTMFDVKCINNANNNMTGTVAAHNNITGTVVGSVAGFVVLVVIIGAIIFFSRRGMLSISKKNKDNGGNHISTVAGTAQKLNNQEGTNTYETVNGEQEREYQRIQFGEEESCVYTNTC